MRPKKRRRSCYLFFLSIFYCVAEKESHKKDVAFLNIAEDGWLHVEAGPVNSPPTQQQPGTLHTKKVNIKPVPSSFLVIYETAHCAGHYEEFFLQSP
jgi:hypothetical protein